MKGFMNRCCFLSRRVRDLIDMGSFAKSRDDNKDLRVEKEKKRSKEKWNISYQTLHYMLSFLLYDNNIRPNIPGHKHY